MTIETIEQAFVEIEKKQEKVPWEAIEFLRSHDKNEKIAEKLKFSLSNAYNKEVYHDKETDYYYPTPLWYAIVAENQVSEELIEPVIQLFITEEERWDYLNEQGMYLVGKLCEEFGDKAVDPILQAILKDSKQKTDNSALFLFDCLHYINKEKHLPIIFEILENENYEWISSFAVHLGNAQITETLDRLKEIKKSLEGETNPKESYLDLLTMGDLEEVITELEEGKNMYPEFAMPYFKKRKDWKEQYKNLYQQPSAVQKPPVLKQKVKVGRNEPCPCGSGKKYKKCCLKKK